MRKYTQNNKGEASLSLVVPLRKRIRAESLEMSFANTHQADWTVLMRIIPVSSRTTSPDCTFPGYGFCPQASLPAERILRYLFPAIYIRKDDIRLLDVPPRTSPMEHLSPTKIIIQWGDSTVEYLLRYYGDLLKYGYIRLRKPCF